MGRSLGCGKLRAVAFLHLKSYLMDLDMPDEIMPILFWVTPFLFCYNFSNKNLNLWIDQKKKKKWEKKEGGRREGRREEKETTKTL